MPEKTPASSTIEEKEVNTNPTMTETFMLHHHHSTDRPQLGRERTGCFFLQSGPAAPSAGAALSG
ncbi:hypothetical protein ABIC35_000178 [Sphingomonas trueperi]